MIYRTPRRIMPKRMNREIKRTDIKSITDEMREINTEVKRNQGQRSSQMGRKLKKRRRRRCG